MTCTHKVVLSFHMQRTVYMFPAILICKGYTLFLYKDHKTELFHLETIKKMKFLEEMSIVAEAVSKAFNAEKMNYELLGNGDTHLHWHLFPRVNGDLGKYGNNGKGPV